MKYADTRCCCSAVCSDALRMEQTAKRSHHADKVSSGVSQHGPRADASLMGPLSHTSVCCCVPVRTRAYSAGGHCIALSAQGRVAVLLDTGEERVFRALTPGAG